MTKTDDSPRRKPQKAAGPPSGYSMVDIPCVDFSELEIKRLAEALNISIQSLTEQRVGKWGETLESLLFILVKDLVNSAFTLARQPSAREVADATWTLYHNLLSASEWLEGYHVPPLESTHHVASAEFEAWITLQEVSDYKGEIALKVVTKHLSTMQNILAMRAKKLTKSINKNSGRRRIVIEETLLKTLPWCLKQAKISTSLPSNGSEDLYYSFALCRTLEVLLDLSIARATDAHIHGEIKVAKAIDYLKTLQNASSRTKLKALRQMKRKTTGSSVPS